MILSKTGGHFRANTCGTLLKRYSGTCSTNKRPIPQSVRAPSKPNIEKLRDKNLPTINIPKFFSLNQKLTTTQRAFEKHASHQNKKAYHRTATHFSCACVCACGGGNIRQSKTSLEKNKKLLVIVTIFQRIYALSRSERMLRVRSQCSTLLNI